ncbi:hypothetical protein BDZ94DRAFT_1180725 [Collybia nuda]|uniref:Uncharacterized protein n=1 Tax=Collybia nuda TaxID=64659 RepID=A0A9P5YL31_9AGAR|nr:hypothetical protein BDZ94DRAFT_1180725 [Collybia nuda]
MDSSRFNLPGFGSPLNFIPVNPKDAVDSLFQNALNALHLESGSVKLPLTTLREFTMLDLMNQMTDKPDWNLKIFDDSITSKWRAEALAAEGRDVTEKMLDWCIAELQHKAKIFGRTGAVSIYRGEVIKSDSAIPNSLKEELKHATAPLEDVPSRFKDWHPGSNEQVLDLVHPSLFPLVYGRSRILPDSLTTLSDFVERCGEGVTLPVPPEKEGKLEPQSYRYHGARQLNDPFSRKFQWLPCDVDISYVDGGVKIKSYINNLHPQKHADLYQVIEKIIARTIPLWNMTLTPLKEGQLDPRIIYDECVYDPDPENGPEEDGPQQGEDEDEDDFWDRRQEWIEATRQVVQPEPDVFKPPGEPEHPVDLRKDYGERGLQIIVKLANIHLTPEKPAYNGGTWHVEGQMNEHICATALYYYDSSNISTSHLAFRQQSDASDAEEVPYPQSQHDWLQVVFGCENEEPAVQDVGVINTKEGRLLTWPNILQHKVQPFHLADHTKPGHRKILALFLVDPNIRIISTANVPCQRKDWWIEVLQKKGGALPNLPAELQDHVFKDVDDFPISLDEAKALRLELMEERKTFVTLQDEAFNDMQFSLCEH